MHSVDKTTLLAKVRAETRDEHEALERAVDLMNPALTIQKYVETLRSFHAFVSRWERFGRDNCPGPLREFFLGRQREEMLLADLKFFGVTPLAMTPELPEFASPSCFYGAMYVMEGSSLGGQVLARHFETKFGLHDRGGYAYFYGRGAETGKMWREFCSTLEEKSRELDGDAVCAGARQMFTALRQWMVLRNAGVGTV